MNAKARQKEKTRSAVLKSAEQLLFQGGFGETSVAKLMANAGLTVGGFYAHFRSKDELLLVAFRSMLGRTLHYLANLRGSPEEKKAKFRELYLSTEHRDHPEMGCPLPAFLFETSRKDPHFRQKFAEFLEQTVRERRELLDLPEAEEDLLLAEFCQWIGAQMLARATKSSPFSDRVLASCRKKS
jgi:TetR/AcrR family transcriptional repressor of nem operon